jgi:hypothetical protein
MARIVIVILDFEKYLSLVYKIRYDLRTNTTKLNYE